MNLKVSENGRFLEYTDGTPFFYLGDTAWELLHALDREEVELYLKNRLEKGFTVIQTVILAERDGLDTPNAYGDKPLIDNDPMKPNEAYFQYVDWVVERANEKGFYVALLPTWGDKWNRVGGIGPEVFNTDNAYWFGKYVSDRYVDRKVIWVLGGDRTPETQLHKDITNAMGRGVKEGASGSTTLCSFHPGGPYPWSNTFHQESWLDFNMFQSSHIGKDRDNYRMLRKDYVLTPPKPCMEDESCYEEHIIMQDGWKFPEVDEYYTDFNVRKAAYWSVFAGGHGYCYGASTVWQFWDPVKHGEKKGCISPWREALDLPGAFQMQHLKKLMLSFPFFTRIPDPEMVLSGLGTGAEHVEATRDSEGTYALVYIPNGGQSVELDTSKLRGAELLLSWFSPIIGEFSAPTELTNSGRQSFTSPADGLDWVLVLQAK